MPHRILNPRPAPARRAPAALARLLLLALATGLLLPPHANASVSRASAKAGTPASLKPVSSSAAATKSPSPAARSAPAAQNTPRLLFTRATLLDSGRVLFRTCALCHGRDGRGDRCPPLVYSDFVQGDRARLIRYVMRPGDTVRVNGVLWRGTEMPPLEGLSDFELAAVLTYIRALNDSLITCTPEDAQAGRWADCRTRKRPAAALAADSITPADVAAIRATLPVRPR